MPAFSAIWQVFTTNGGESDQAVRKEIVLDESKSGPSLSSFSSTPLANGYFEVNRHT